MGLFLFPEPCTEHRNSAPHAAVPVPGSLSLPLSDQEKERRKDGDPWTTIVPFTAIFILCLFFMIDPEGSKGALSAIRFFLGDTFGTYYLIIELGVGVHGSYLRTGCGHPVLLHV